jgi:hypothetical protein
MQGTKLPSLGIASLSQTGEPTFRPSPELTTQYKLKFESTSGSPDNMGSSNLNFSQVGALAGVSREVAEKVYSKIVSTLGKKLLSGRSILLSFHKVMELRFSGGVLRADMFSSSSPRPVGAGQRGAQPAARFPGENLFESKNKTALQGGRRQPDKLDNKASTVQRARNPITGEFDTEAEEPPTPPKRAPNNVILSGKLSLKFLNLYLLNICSLILNLSHICLNPTIRPPFVCPKQQQQQVDS